MMQLVPAQPTDAATLTSIAHAAKRHWGYPESWITVWADQLTITAESIQTRPTWIALESGIAVGFFQLSQLGRAVRLDHLWVLPEAMGRGIGTALFHAACAEGTRMGWPTLRLISDPHAEGFYLRRGAVRIGTDFDECQGTVRELPVLLVRLAAAG